MFFKLYRCVCCSLAGFVEVKLPVADLSPGFSGDLFSVWEIKAIPSNNTGLWIYSLLNDPLRQPRTLKPAGDPAGQVLRGVQRFTHGKSEIGGFEFSFGEIISKEDYGKEERSRTERIWWLWARGVIHKKLYSCGKNPKNQRSNKLSVARAFLLIYIYAYNHLQSI